MSRSCTICLHLQRADIEASLLDRHETFRGIAEHFGLTTTSVYRNRTTHMAAKLRESQEARDMLDAEALAARLLALDESVHRVLQRGEKSGDDRLVLLAVKEGRLDLESYAKIGVMSDVEKRLAALEAGKDGEAEDGEATDE
jgi:hypothetical protein